jgi:magnesium transporter
MSGNQSKEAASRRGRPERSGGSRDGDPARSGDAGRDSAADAKRDAPDTGSGLRAFLYDADGDDRDVSPDEELLAGLADDDLLWMDVDASSEGAVERVAELASVDAAALDPAAHSEPFIRDFGDALVIGVLPPPAQSREGAGAAAGDSSGMLVCAMGRNWLATLHHGETGALREFADHLRGDSTQGRLDAPSFLARLLEWVLNAYFDHLDRLQESIDDIEVHLLKERARRSSMEQLVSLRHDVAGLRRRLSPHRQVLVSLSHPSFDVLSGSEAAQEYQVLVDRLETAIQTADTTREMIVEAFDVFMTQSAQRTNDFMRVLTTVTVVLLPASLIAGIFGMNMLPKYLIRDWVFWAVLAAMLVVGAALVFTVRSWYARSR